MRSKLLLSFLGVVFIIGGWRTVAGEEFKACSLVTTDEIKEMVGITVGQGFEDSMGTDMEQCSWASEEEDLSLLISFQKASSNAEKICEEQRTWGKEHGQWLADTTGFGDQAWWSFKVKDKAVQILTLSACTKKGILRVNLWGKIDQPRHKKMIESLTRKALPRL